MDNPLTAMSAVVVCSALLAWLASQTRQPIIAGYFLGGILLGPAGLGFVTPTGVLDDISRLGVMLLLFLAGLVLHPDRLRTFFRTAVVVTLAGSALAWVLVFALLRVWGHSGSDSSVAGVALMFSSTILVVKLLPTTTLHQKRMGSVCIAILVAQDLLAVLALLFVGPQVKAGPLLLWLPAMALLLTAFAVLGEQFVVRRMMQRADRYNEVLIMLCLGWCVGVALLAARIGIPYEIGAFVAGLTLARGKIALVLSEQLKPLRDFFLMFFFFVLGAGLEFVHLRDTWLPALLVAVVIVFSRPLWFRYLFRWMGEEPGFAKETGVRLGQASEFALVIAVAASEGGRLSTGVTQLVQLATVLTMLMSSYVVVLKYPTPIGVRPNLQRD
jgi:Kef-type K+ transport system membrane component KefB